MSATNASPVGKIKETSSSSEAELPLHQRSFQDTRWQLARPILEARFSALMKNQIQLQQALVSLQRSMATFAMESRQQIALNKELTAWMEQVKGATVLGNFEIKNLPPAPTVPLPVLSTAFPTFTPSPEAVAPIVPPSPKVIDGELVSQLVKETKSL